MVLSNKLQPLCLVLCFCVLNVLADGGNAEKDSRKSTPGILTSVAVDSDEIKEAVTFALDELTKRESVNSKLVLLQTVEAKKQVVSGMSYQLTLKVSESTCTKGDTSVDCKPLPGGKLENCSLKVWSQPWQKKMEIQGQMTCKELRL